MTPRSLLSCTTLTVIASMFVGGGCSSLGISLYPSSSVLTPHAADVLTASSIPADIPRENAKAVLDAHALAPGDAVLIEPFDLEGDLRLPADQVVQADGSIDLGPYGRVIVAGRTLEEAESLIERQIVDEVRRRRLACGDEESDSRPAGRQCDAVAVNVRLLEPVHRFYVLGEVNAPGSFPLTGSETVLDALIQAGGLAAGADTCKIMLVRPTDPSGCRVTLPVCYREVVQLGNTGSNYQIQPNDRVFVASRSWQDELMFWKSTASCEKCSDCRGPSAYPAAVRSHSFPAVESTQIRPGSTGRLEFTKDPLNGRVSRDQDTMNSRSEEPASAETLYRRNPISDHAPTPPGAAAKIPKHADFDGELDFE